MSEFTEDYNASINEEGNPMDQYCSQDFTNWKTYKFQFPTETKYGIFKLFKYLVGYNPGKPNLVTMSGFSNNSFCEQARIIIRNIEKLMEKFNIFMLEFPETEFKDLQKNACTSRDNLFNTSVRNTKSLNADEYIKKVKELTIEKREEVFQPEIDLNEELGTIIDKLLRSAGFTNVHLLGKCAGGGVAIHTFTKSPIYEALYLAVPASPLNIIPLLKLNKVNPIKNKKLIFAWDNRDGFTFNWNYSNQERVNYDMSLASLYPDNTVITASFEHGASDPKKYHQIPEKLFDLLLL